MGRGGGRESQFFVNQDDTRISWMSGPETNAQKGPAPHEARSHELVSDYNQASPRAFRQGYDSSILIKYMHLLTG